MMSKISPMESYNVSISKSQTLLTHNIVLQTWLHKLAQNTYTCLLAILILFTSALRLACVMLAELDWLLVHKLFISNLLFHLRASQTSAYFSAPQILCFL